MSKKMAIFVLLILCVVFGLLSFIFSKRIELQHNVAVFSTIPNISFSISDENLFQDRMRSWDAWGSVNIPVYEGSVLHWQSMVPRKYIIELTSQAQQYDTYAYKAQDETLTILQSLGYAKEGPDLDTVHIYIQMNEDSLRENDKRAHMVETSIFKAIYYLTHKDSKVEVVREKASEFSQELLEKGSSLHVSVN